MSSTSKIRGVMAHRAATLAGLGIFAAAGTAAVLALGMSPAGAVTGPTVTAVSPAKVDNTTSAQVILITGSGFTGATALSVNAVSETNYFVVSDTQIVATIDDSALTTSAGNSILVTNSHAVTNTANTLLTATGAPTTDNVLLPGAGSTSGTDGPVAGGGKFIITGTNLTGAVVKIGSTTATTVVVAGVGGTTATVTLPPMAAVDQAANIATGLNVTVTTPAYPGAPLTLGTKFTYDAAIASLSTHFAAPTGTAPGGANTIVDIKGSGFTGLLTNGGTAAIATPVLASTATANTGGNLVAATYSYRVSALTASGETLASTAMTRVVPGGTATNTVTVNWTAVPGATGYKVYGRTAGSELFIATLGGVVTYTDTGTTGVPFGALPGSNTTTVLAAPTVGVGTTATTGGSLAAASYSYMVTSTNATGQTMVSSAEVVDASGSGTSTNTVTVNWTPVVGATGYKVYGRTAGSEVLITTLGNVATFVDDGSLTPAGAQPGSNTTTILGTPATPTTATATTGGFLAAGSYSYRVAALNPTGVTLASTGVVRVVPAGTATNTVTVNWTLVTGATGYKVYARTAGSELLLATVGNVATFTDVGQSGVPVGALPLANTTAVAPTNVTFNGVAVAVGKLMILSDTEMFAQVPNVLAGARTGNVVVSLPAIAGIATAGGRSAVATGTTGTAGTNSAWFYVDAPTVTALNLHDTTAAAIGAPITVTGIGFNTPAGTLSVSFGTVKVIAANVTVVSNTSLTVKVPTGVPVVGVADVTITNAIGTSARSSVDRFLYLPTAAPVVTSAVGTIDHVNGGAILITGANFTGATAVKAAQDGTTLGNVASFIVLSDTQIIAVLSTLPVTSPVAAAGDSWSVSVTNQVAGGTTTLMTGAFLLS